MSDLQKSRQNQSVSDETMANYTAARAFLLGEWLGALLMVASFTLLYAWGLRPGAPVKLATGIGLAMMALGTYTFWRSRRIYQSVDFPIGRRWEIMATLLAATAVVFWLFALVAYLLVQAGVNPF